MYKFKEFLKKSTKLYWDDFTKENVLLITKLKKTVLYLVNFSK